MKVFLAVPDMRVVVDLTGGFFLSKPVPQINPALVEAFCRVSQEDQEAVRRVNVLVVAERRARAGGRVSVIFEKLKTLAARIRGRTVPVQADAQTFAGPIFPDNEHFEKILRSAEAKNLEHVSALGKLANWVREAVEEPGLPDEMRKRGGVLLKNLERTL